MMDYALTTGRKWRFRKAEMPKYLQLPSSKFSTNFVKMKFVKNVQQTKYVNRAMVINTEFTTALTMQTTWH